MKKGGNVSIRSELISLTRETWWTARDQLSEHDGIKQMYHEVEIWL